ncbi:hypothetical protein [Escherichia phage vB_EcoM_JNE01]|nr:hypothetical protein [Escherichia phage vB_EcoM_JNE01]
MISLYVAVMLTHGQIDRTVGKGVYTTADECYTATAWPQDEGSSNEFKCLKVKGDFVNLKVVEAK